VAVDLLYRMRRSGPYPVNSDKFFFVDNLVTTIQALPVLVRDRGWVGCGKVVAKIVLGRCIYFGLASESRPQSTGTLALGYSRFYPVESDAIVIGEIVTVPESRGQGLATLSVMLAINAVVRRGARTFYIDTQRMNVAMQRAITKLGFGPPIGGDAAPKNS
jgi:RimJ/RimL family protein N-acetyltransferase